MLVKEEAGIMVVVKEEAVSAMRNAVKHVVHIAQHLHAVHNAKDGTLVSKML
jgi:hypothetical protein